MITKQKAVTRYKQLSDCLQKLGRKRRIQPEISPQIPTYNQIVSLSPPVVPKFAINAHVSITPDTSQRGYLCNRIQGRVSGFNLSPDGSSFIYDIQKIIDGYILRPRRIENNSIKIN
jgi:hypothetical protein